MCESFPGFRAAANMFNVAINGKKNGINSKPNYPSSTPSRHLFFFFLGLVPSALFVLANSSLFNASFITQSALTNESATALDPYHARIRTRCSTKKKVIGTTILTHFSDNREPFLTWVSGHTNKTSEWPANHTAVTVVARYPEPIDVLDVGANVGQESFQIMTLGMGHRVLTVEPEIGNFERLCKTGMLNGWIGDKMTLVHAALSDRVDESSIFVPKGRADNTAISAEASNGHVSGEREEQKIKLLDGDGLLQATGFRPRFIKIDTQGHELFVLKGLKNYLKNAKKGEVIILAEFDTKLMGLSGVRPTQIVEFMEGLQFKAYCGMAMKMDGQGFVEITSRQVSLQNMTGRTGCGDITWAKN